MRTILRSPANPKCCPRGWKAGIRWPFGVQSLIFLFLALPFVLLVFTMRQCSKKEKKKKEKCLIKRQIACRVLLFEWNFFSLKFKMIFAFSLETQLFLFIPSLCIGQFCFTYFVKITYAYEKLHVIFKNANASSFARKKYIRLLIEL